MSWIHNSIRNRLFISLLSFTLIIVIQLSISLYAIREIEKIAELRDRISSVNTEWLNIYVNLYKYINQDTRNLDYFKTQRSNFLEFVKHEKRLLTEQLETMADHAVISDIDMKGMVDSMIAYFDSYKILLSELEEKVLERGFKDYGLEGEMRQNIHALENSEFVPLERVLAIRRNEKDYLLRGDSNYALAVRKIVEKEIALLKSINSPESLEEISLLSSYVEVFNQLVDVNTELGLYNDSGIKKQIELRGDFLVDRFSRMKTSFSDRVENQLFILRGTLFISAIIILLLSLVLSIFIAKQLTRPIRRLAKNMENLQANRKGNGEQKGLKVGELPEEIKSLNHAFVEMKLKINTQFDEISKKNETLEEQNLQLERLNQEMDKFIYHTSHDLRSPLTSISGLMELITQDEEDSKEEYFEYIKSCVNQMDNTITDIIHFYKNRSLELMPNKVDVLAIANQVFEQNRYHPKAKDLNFRVQSIRNFVPITDEYRINIVIRNLITNAIKYHDDSKANRFIEVEVFEEENNWVLRVSDNGQGIPQEHQKRVFEMFYRASDQSKGSGLGLYIVMESLKKLSGDLRLYSKEGEGTTIEVLLPLIRDRVHSECADSAILEMT